MILLLAAFCDKKRELPHKFLTMLKRFSDDFVTV